MEVKSEPKTVEVHFTDIDVAYPGEIRSLTLENDKDSSMNEADAIWVNFASGEEVVLFKAQMHWYSIRPRVQKRKVEEPKS